jgi:hypothetical protein
MALDKDRICGEQAMQREELLAENERIRREEAAQRERLLAEKEAMDVERHRLLQEVNLARDRTLYYADLCRIVGEDGNRLKTRLDQLEAEFAFVKRSCFYRGWLKYQALYSLPFTGPVLRKARGIARRILHAARRLRANGRNHSAGSGE